jgi:hypothetical protein
MAFKFSEGMHRVCLRKFLGQCLCPLTELGDITNGACGHIPCPNFHIYPPDLSSLGCQELPLRCIYLQLSAIMLLYGTYCNWWWSFKIKIVNIVNEFVPIFIQEWILQNYFNIVLLLRKYFTKMLYSLRKNYFRNLPDCCFRPVWTTHRWENC